MRSSRLVDFSDAFANANTYPTNVLSPSKHAYQLKDYVDHLKNLQSSLFCDPSHCALDVLETSQDGVALETGCIRNTTDLNQHLGTASVGSRHDPTCRFAFITAPNAREKLNVDRDTLLQILSWHQVMPDVLDFLFAFGQTDHPRDFHFTGFRSEARLLENDDTVCLPELGRSGRELRMCYTIKSVESVSNPTSQQTWPWSIRTTSLYHSFDLETNHSFWLMIKANTLLRNRVKALCDGGRLYRADIASEVERRRHAFESTIQTHQLLCALAGENWRWYIGSIEVKVQDLTRGTLTEEVDLYQQAPRRAQSWRVTEKQSTPAPPEEPVSSRFSFEHLQQVHFVEEKVNEALLIIRANMSVLQDLAAYYAQTVKILRTRSDGSLLDIRSLEASVSAAVNDLSMQESRLEMLLRLLADRRSLLGSMLQWKNAQMTLRLADKAQASADEMADMTSEMQRIAADTKTETINMRIITLVTLFFLPGTFISTLMSTSIVQYQADKMQINAAPLLLYLEVSLPLLFGTLLFWYLSYRWEGWRSNKKESSQQDVGA